MLQHADGLYCGVFDSRVLRGAQTRSPDRTVLTYELELFHSGPGVSHVNGGRYPACRGMLLCAKPGQIRHSEFPVRCSYLRFPSGCDADIEKLLAALPDCTYLNDDRQIEELMGLFTRLSGCFIGGLPSGLTAVRMNALLMELIYRVCRLCAPPVDPVSDAPVSRITRETLEYINDHERDDCSLKSIAAAVQVSPNHLHAVFRREVGMTPYEYALERRIARAQRLIMAGEMSMTEIALETGFCSQSHFNRVFRQKTGATPVEYRKNLLRQYDSLIP